MDKQPSEQFKTVPVMASFSDNVEIGSLSIDVSKLPPQPGFLFALGFLGAGLERGAIPDKPYNGKWDLVAVAVVSDDKYFAYLKQVGVATRDNIEDATPPAGGGDAEIRQQAINLLAAEHRRKWGDGGALTILHGPRSPEHEVSLRAVESALRLASGGGAKVPVPQDVMQARAQGRAEALAIILGLDAEEGLSEYTDSVPPGPSGDWGTQWNEAKLRDLLRADDTAWSLLQEAEGQYWHNFGLREEAQRLGAGGARVGQEADNA